MGALRLTAAGALVQTLNILQTLSSHLTVAFLHVRGLLLGDGAEDGFPEIGEQRRNGDGDGDGGEGEGEDGGREARPGGEETEGHGGKQCSDQVLCSEVKSRSKMINEARV